MIIDTFIFNQDFNSLKIRLAELYDIVDFFIISESAYTHTGKPKSLYLSENLYKFSIYKDKIIIVTSNKKLITRNAFIRELYQRELISKYLKSMKLNNGDLIIHSDCDEIPNKNILIELAKNKENVNVILDLNAYSTRLNLFDGKWQRGRIISFNFYKSISKMRQDIFLFKNYDLRRHKLPLIRIPKHFTHRYFGLWIFPYIVTSKPSLQIIHNGGWHFNNLFDLDKIREKIQSSVHTELDTMEVRSKLDERYKMGRDIYSGKQLQIVQIDETFPECIQNNLKEWDDYIIKLSKIP